MKALLEMGTKSTLMGSISRPKIIARAILTAIILVGLGVLIGWHLHLRFLVQIMPGVIPMQYNTALCFIVMGISGLLVVGRRGLRILPVIGGLLLTVMGSLVIYEYASGTSLGIDTAFFYPWDLTLLSIRAVWPLPAQSVSLVRESRSSGFRSGATRWLHSQSCTHCL
ncbi:MAG: hypothetical protein ACR2H4_13635 [Pyrinomonadaceae bacterium]